MSSTLTFCATRKVSLRMPCSNSRDFCNVNNANIEINLSRSAVIKKNRGLVIDSSHLWLSELPEHGCQTVVISVTVGLYSHIQDMDRLILDTLVYKGKTHFIQSCTVAEVKEVTTRTLISSPCCHLHHTAQDFLLLGRLDLEEESQRSSSTHPLCSCDKENYTCNRLNVMIYYLHSSWDWKQNKDWPGELLEGAERDHGSHALTRRRKRCVKKNITHAGHVNHAVVVQVGWERHPKVLTGSHL